MKVTWRVDNLTGFGGPQHVLWGPSEMELGSGAGMEILGSVGLSVGLLKLAGWRSGGDGDPQSTSDIIDLNLTYN